VTRHVKSDTGHAKEALHALQTSQAKSAITTVNLPLSSLEPVSDHAEDMSETSRMCGSEIEADMPCSEEVTSGGSYNSEQLDAWDLSTNRME